MKFLKHLILFLIATPCFAAGLPDITQSFRVLFTNCHPTSNEIRKVIQAPPAGYDTLETTVTSLLKQDMSVTAFSKFSDVTATWNVSQYRIQLRLPVPAFPGANLFITTTNDFVPFVVTVPALGSDSQHRETRFGQTQVAGGLDQDGFVTPVEVFAKCLGGQHSVQLSGSGQVSIDNTNPGAIVSMKYRDLL